MSAKKTKYVDGFVLVVPKENIDDYKKMASEAGEVWMKHGALRYRECMLEDGNPQPDDLTFTFPIMTKVKPKADETVWFSYIEFESKAHRDEVNASVMEDPYMKNYDDGSTKEEQMEKMPFDVKRMAYGGFEVMVGGD